MRDTTPLILLSGMGADARIFEPQLAAFPNLSVPPWLAPEPEESMRNYAIRFASRIDRGKPIYLGGMSFGGMVALEMLQHLPVRRCFLISTIRSRSELPRRLRSLASIGRRSSLTGTRMTTRAASALLGFGADRLDVGRRAYLEQIAASDPHFLKWAVRAMFTWEEGPRPADVPIHHIHGGRDPVLPARLTSPDQIIEGAGHVITLSHGHQVNRFLRERMATDAP